MADDAGAPGPDTELEYAHRMSDADMLMWTVEHDPLLRSTITSIVLLDQAPDPEAFADKMERASRRVPRLRQRVVSNPLSVAPPRWEIDPNFDIRFHLRRVRASGDGSLRNLFAIAEPLAMQGFDRARPLWEFTVVEDLEDGRAGLIMKVHHAITDGVGGIKLMLETFDAEPDPGDLGPMPEEPEVHVMSQPERVVDAVLHERRRTLGVAKRSLGNVTGALRDAVGDPVGAGLRVAETLGSAARLLQPATEPMSPVMTGRSLSVRFDSLTVPLSDTKAAARRAGGRLNDAFVAAVIGGFRLYHERHDCPASALRMSMPINIRTKETEGQAGNQFAPARFGVPLTIRDPVARMRAVHDLVAEARAEPALALVEPMAAVLNRLPKEVVTSVFGSMLRGVDFVTSNVPGAPFPLYVAGAAVEAHFALGPMAGAASNVTLLSYMDELHIGFNTDPAAIPDPDVLMECMREAFDEVLKA